MSFRSIDESDQKATTLLMARLQTLAKRFNSAIILTHHLRKTSANDEKQHVDQDAIIGSSALVRQCGNAFILRKCGFDILQLCCVKAWWELPKATTYKLVKSYDGIVFEEAFIENNMTEKRLRLQKFLNETPPEQWPTERELGQKFNIPKSTVHYVCEKLTQDLPKNNV
ncbi:MAG: hypothetical protein IJ859_02830 [Synergistaceae bacterium]|nr:hypothetical protein [Synergistaceae bacterium]